MSSLIGADVVVVHISVGSIEEAQALADHLVAQRLAACVQQHPITSTYRWNDQLMRSEEVLLMAKAASDKLSELKAAVLALHSYDLPEIVVLPVLDGHQPYLDWVVSEA